MVASSTPVVPTDDKRSVWPRQAARAGALAALAMLFGQLAIRLAVGGQGAPSFPETVVAAVARLTPLGLFGWATETFGSLAQNTLFVAVLVGIVAAGYGAGAVAGRWAWEGRWGSGSGRRWAAGAAVAALLLLVALGAVLPLGNYGPFGLGSRHAAALLVQFVATFALWALLWPLLAGPLPFERPATVAGPVMSRRAAWERGAVGVGAVALLGGVGAMALQLMRPRNAGDPAARAAAARAIEATAEARARQAAAAPVAPTSAPVPQLALGGDREVGSNVGAAPAQAAAQDDALLGAVPSFAQLEREGRLTPRLTPIADFYHVSKNIADPVVDGAGWSLTIDGLVERPVTYALAQLTERASVKRITTLGCISNELNGDLISTAEWTAVPLVELLDEAGVKPGVVDLRFLCADDYEDSIPLAQALDPETMLVVGMNGEPLPPDNGYPARMIVPPIYGMKNVKWLERIELVDYDVKGYWQQRGWSDPAPYQIWGRIDTPRSGEDVAPGPVVAAGLAFAGDRGVSKVELSLDLGQTWAVADLEPALNAPFTWVRWRLGFDAVDDIELWLRVTDGVGNVAPEERRSPLPDGATGWPLRRLNVRPS